MEIELLDASKIKWSTLALLAMLLVGWLGWRVTPAAGVVLSWTEYQVAQNQRIYRRELRQMQQDVRQLDALLAGPPDPVRVSYQVQAILRQLDGQQLSLLSPQREALAQAALAVQDWANGWESLENAGKVLDDAASLIIHD